MSQTWPIPIDSTDLLSDSRVDLNFALDSLLTNFIGTGDITGAALVDGAIWVNTTLQKIRARRAGATINLGDWTDNMGFLRRDGTSSSMANQDMNDNRILNVGAGNAGSSDAARMLDVEARVSKGGDIDSRTMSAPLLFSGDYMGYISAANAAAPMGKLTQYMPLSGGAFTGDNAVTIPADSGAGVTEVINKGDIQNLTSFNTTAGHRHTGDDSRKILATSLDTTGAANNTLPFANGTGGLSMATWASKHMMLAGNPSAAATFSSGFLNYQTVDLTGLVPAGAPFAFLKCELISWNRLRSLRLRKGGEASDGVQHNWGTVVLDTAVSSSLVNLYFLAIVPLSSSLTFEFKADASGFGSPTVTFYVM